MSVAERMTAEEFLALPDRPEYRYAQLIGGELVVNAPVVKHQYVCDGILFEVTTWTRAQPGRGRAISPLSVLIGQHDVYQPDLLWYRDGRVPQREDRPPYPVPDLAVEVRSPSTWRYDIGAKKAGYERRGLPELWLVDTAADVVLVFRRSKPDAPQFDVALELARGDTLSSPLLPGFGVKLDQLFG